MQATAATRTRLDTLATNGKLAAIELYLTFCGDENGQNYFQLTLIGQIMVWSSARLPMKRKIPVKMAANAIARVTGSLLLPGIKAISI
ncbi:hypothetical protein Ptr902_01435 [Pyrenophora tritici-repentis]|nr:hypothetical protein TUN199_04720 [Pyrenophora tritici-repentis]KAI2487302.1 hypothetical protein Ptr902_01435 [Pyrenophora tritici-repentis]